ncbi:PREDICTED: protein RALF-like 22 [Tarenaya hassleriana]|uniref:protein RALF-like 22 n=1 Tax=Tarenaya hassleriana TaxID=28532 RepID=UPI00053C65D2|nr:PREDICTED: protein RALF-like 22 [Tarenaya hassleriana]
MVRSRAIYGILSILAILTAAVESADDYGAAVGLIRTGSSLSGCKGSIAECMAEEEELELGSEISRRILATNKYISYGALQRNSVPCSRRGASYYNCRRGAQANPYSRGCSTITRCRR